MRYYWIDKESNKLSCSNFIWEKRGGRADNWFLSIPTVM